MSLHFFPEELLPEEELRLDACLLRVHHPSLVSADLLRQALLARLSDLADEAQHALCFDCSPSIHLHLVLLSDAPLIPPDRLLSFTGLIRRLQEQLYHLTDLGFNITLTSQLLRGLRMSPSYRTDGSPNSSFLSTAQFRWKVGLLDTLLSKAMIASSRPLYVLLYLPDVSSLDGRTLYAGNRSHHTGTLSGFSFTAGGRQHLFVVWNNEPSHEVLRLVAQEIKLWLGLPSDYDYKLRKPLTLNGCSFRLELFHDGCNSSEGAISEWDRLLLDMIWTRQGNHALKEYIAIWNNLSAMSVGRTSFSLLTAERAHSQDKDTWREAINFRQRLWSSDRHWTEEFTFEQIFIILAPFWVPLLAPLLKMWRNRRTKNQQATVS